MTTEDELIALALRHAADGTAPEQPTHAYEVVAAALALKLESMSELERVRLLHPHVTNAERRQYYNHVARCAGWQLMEEAAV